jgi:hypothetical protein
MTNPENIGCLDCSFGIHRFDAHPLSVAHALLLLGTDPERFSTNLTYYLESAKTFLNYAHPGLLRLPAGSTPDFKKRFAEDLGVSIGTLFLAHTIALRIDTVTQIPTNKRLDRHAKVPDFLGFDNSNNKWVYECKGTTQPNNIDEQRSKAKKQLNDYPDKGPKKLALCLYIPLDNSLLPPFLFVSDPPGPLTNISSWIAFALHFYIALKYSSFDETAEAYRNAIALDVEYRLKRDSNAYLSGVFSDKAARARLKIQESWLKETNGCDTISIDGRLFVGKERPPGKSVGGIRIFTGIDKVHADKVIGLIASTHIGEDNDPPRHSDGMQEFSVGDGKASVFPDGTILMLYK